VLLLEAGVRLQTRHTDRQAREHSPITLAFMTATLARPPVHDEEFGPAWRERLQPAVPGHGGWGATALVTLLGGLLRFLRLDLPATTYAAGSNIPVGPGKIFDEVYYACDAQNLLRYGVEHATFSYTGTDPALVRKAASCVVEPGSGGAFIVHPPLGKWLIAGGEQLFGINTLGWRFSAAVFGTLTILLVVRIGRRMTGSTLLGALAGTLLSLDGLHFVQSRTSMLDIFLCFWIVAAFGCLVVDRDKVRKQLSRASDADIGRGGGWLLSRPWLALCGVCLGAAIATKWSGIYVLPVLLLLAVAWEAGARRTAGVRLPVVRTLVRTTGPLLAALVLLPAAVYVASWAGWFVTDIGYDRHWADADASTVPLMPDVLRSWWHYHAEIYHFHDTLTTRHPYQSHPASWLVLGRPVNYYYPSPLGVGRYGCRVTSCVREVLAIGTPALWWAIVPAVLGLVAMWVSRRDWRASSLTLMLLAGIAPWEPSDLKHRTMFLFYALPSIPFLCLGLALLAGWALGRAGTTRRTVASAAVGVYVSVVLLNFAYLYPVLAAVTIPYQDWLDRMWFHSWI